jgi:hypothetical protein
LRYWAFRRTNGRFHAAPLLFLRIKLKRVAFREHLIINMVGTAYLLHLESLNGLISVVVNSVRSSYALSLKILGQGQRFDPKSLLLFYAIRQQ